MSLYIFFFVVRSFTPFCKDWHSSFGEISETADDKRWISPKGT
uniref:Uncharacterized protein n=1 Tax=Anguilla anguilla TaxID=7936 RepID=A0A0E9RWU9_ANGAN